MAKALREKLQTAFVKNVYRNYVKKKDGGIYETFHPYTGKGNEVKNSRLMNLGGNHVPFTGWTSLVLLIMSEFYPL